MKRAQIEKMIYNSGDVFLPPKIKQLLDTDIFGSSKKTLYFSGWSIMHFISGILMGYIYLYLQYNPSPSMYFYKMFVIHTMWELWQMLIGMSKPYNLTGSSNLIDTILDTVFFMIGTYIPYVVYKSHNA